jgi:hypothetical protein
VVNRQDGKGRSSQKVEKGAELGRLMQAFAVVVDIETITSNSQPSC